MENGTMAIPSVWVWLPVASIIVAILSIIECILVFRYKREENESGERVYPLRELPPTNGRQYNLIILAETILFLAFVIGSAAVIFPALGPILALFLGLICVVFVGMGGFAVFVLAVVLTTVCFCEFWRRKGYRLPDLATVLLIIGTVLVVPGVYVLFVA